MRRPPSLQLQLPLLYQLHRMLARLKEVWMPNRSAETTDGDAAVVEELVHMLMLKAAEWARVVGEATWPNHIMKRGCFDLFNE